MGEGKKSVPIVVMAPNYIHILIVFMAKVTWQLRLNWDLED